MKIDIHTHTRKCKAGDAPSRDIAPKDFCEKIESTDVGIVAITNHNVFDFDQYSEIVELIVKPTQVWPGIELDVIEDGKRGHLIVIVSPSKAKEFAHAVEVLTNGSTADTFTTNINQVLEKFEIFNPLYVAHYMQKKPDISDEALEKLLAGAANKNRIIKEVTNSISAGIHISHGRASIYGSDVHDWASYEQQALSLPDLRLPVESFEQFCLLLDKDATTINTALDKKIAEELVLVPFEDETTIKLRVFNDINVIFGPKGTGKSRILEAIEKHYCTNGVDAKYYASSTVNLKDMFDIKGKDIVMNLRNHDIEYCTDEIDAVRSAVEIGVTSLSKYSNYFRTETTNRNAKKMKLKNIEPEDSSSSERRFGDLNKAKVKTSRFRDFADNEKVVKEVLSDEEHRKLMEILSELDKRLGDAGWSSFSNWKQVSLLNLAIAIFRSEIQRKTGAPAKPTETGFREYALNRLNVEVCSSRIIENLRKNIPVASEKIGSLGPNKGTLQLQTLFKFQDSSLADSSLNKFKAVKKSSQKQFAKILVQINEHVYKDDLFLKISELNAIDDVEAIKSVYELLQFKRYFALDGVEYEPSTGESSMVVLHKELELERDVYILDEPELSLGNQYINDVIVPLINERARTGKKVFISTHDANIAVRTLPYCSIYRFHDVGGHATYVGNPFSNNLINIEDSSDILDWKKVSMETLEGGEEAFGERGKIYGNS